MRKEKLKVKKQYQLNIRFNAAGLKIPSHSHLMQKKQEI